MKSIAVIGLGNFGYALLKYLDSKNKGQFELYGFDRKEETVSYLIRTRHHPKLFKHIKISKNVAFTSNLAQAVENADYIILSVSSEAVEEILAKIKPSLKEHVVIINTAKSLEYNSGQRYSEIAEKILQDKSYDYVVLAGGTIAADVFRRDPLGITVACKNTKIHQDLKNILNAEHFHVDITTDVAGVEYAASFKNVVSILAGIVRGMGLSYGSETYVISQAAGEVKNLVVNHLGGQANTFSINSQCWGNDMWMSCTGKTRNREFGILLGRGKSVKEALSVMEKQNKLVEGVHTIQVLEKFPIKDYPLLFYLYNLFHGKAQLEEIRTII